MTAATLLGTAVVLALAQPAGAAALSLTAGAVKTIATHVDPQALACPRGAAVSAETCFVLGDPNGPASFLIPVVDGVPQNKTISVDSAVSVACPTKSTCVVVAVTSTSGEIEWVVNEKVARTVTLTGSSFLYGVACESSTTCIVVGEKYGTTTNTAVVSVVTESESTPAVTTVPGVDDLQDVACVSNSQCYAVGSTTGGSTGAAVVVPITSGKVGKPLKAKGSDGLEHISCGSSTECWASGTSFSSTKGILDVVLPVKAGVPGPTSSAPEYGNQLACVSATTCLYGSSTAQYTGKGIVDEMTNGKIVASVSISGLAYGALTGIACPTTSSCIATGAESFHNPGPDYYYVGGVVSVSV